MVSLIGILYMISSDFSKFTNLSICLQVVLERQT